MDFPYPRKNEINCLTKIYDFTVVMNYCSRNYRKLFKFIDYKMYFVKHCKFTPKWRYWNLFDYDNRCKVSKFHIHLIKIIMIYFEEVCSHTYETIFPFHPSVRFKVFVVQFFSTFYSPPLYCMIVSCIFMLRNILFYMKEFIIYNIIADKKWLWWWWICNMNTYFFPLWAPQSF